MGEYKALSFANLTLRPTALDMGRCPLILGKHLGDFLDYIVDDKSLYAAVNLDLIGWFGSWVRDSMQRQAADFFLCRAASDELQLFPPRMYKGEVPLFICSLCGDLECGAIGCRIVKLDDSYIWTDFWSYRRGPIEQYGLDDACFRFEALNYETIFEDLARGKQYDFSQRLFIRPSNWVNAGALPFPWNVHQRQKPPEVDPERSVEVNIRDLEVFLDIHGWFNYQAENDLRHLWLSIDPLKAQYYANDILRFAFMDAYQLNVLSDWLIGNDDARAIEILLQKASEFPQFAYLQAACRLKAAELLDAMGKAAEAREVRQSVASSSDPDLSEYTQLANKEL